jgi:RNA polymerase sigma-70 factor (ECF subfamily)
MRPVDINGDPGAIYVDDQDRVLGVWALEIADGEITGIRSIVNPDKLAHLGEVGDVVAILRSAR